MERNSKDQVHKRTLICEFDGKYKSKKKDEAKLKGTQRNTKTKKLGCPCEEVINEISLMTKHRNLTLTAQRNFLKPRFPVIHFQDQDLANLIQKYKNMDKINNDASALLTMLMQRKLKIYAGLLILN
ncbi:hypothetical protein RhiirB3_448319 [Rhizophagus irregularis]|nr:hypothetical protein RhiirB3_448319 [Rhizophagus irregularis]